MNKLIQEQLAKVENADLSRFDSSTNSYFIPRRVDIKIEEDKCYIIKIKPSLYNNEVLKTNWNNNSLPTITYLTVDIAKILNKMIRVTAVGYDIEHQVVMNYFWSGWLTLNDIEVLKKI